MHAVKFCAAKCFFVQKFSRLKLCTIFQNVCLRQLHFESMTFGLLVVSRRQTPTCMVKVQHGSAILYFLQVACRTKFDQEAFEEREFGFHAPDGDFYLPYWLL